MATCPTCRTRYPNEVKTCATDGETLLPDEAFAAADPDLAAGQQVGEYQIEGKLGEGSFGCVYRAVHPLIGKAAAIKVLNRQYSSNPQMVSRFIAEARAVNQIRNRNIIDIFSFGQLADGRQYYVMELLDGMTFNAYLKQKGRLGPEEAVPILRGIARALGAAHQNGIAHRDLKPENVFLAMEDDGAVFPKLLDFGIAKLLGDSLTGHKTRTGTPMGTPHYMSPEQCRGRNVDHRTDIYSFGILVFETLTGKLPFDGEDVMELLMKQTSAPAPRPSEICPELPPAIDDPVLHMLEKDPSKRPETVIAAIDALAAAAQGAGYDVPAAPKRADPRPGASAPRTTGPAVSTGPVAPARSDPALAEARTMLQGEGTAKTLLPSETDVKPAGGKRTLVLGAIAAAVLSAGGMFFALRGSGSPIQQVGPLPGSAPVAALPAPPPAATPVEPRVTASAAMPAEPAAPAEIELTIESTPKVVDVYLGKDKLGDSSAPLKLKRAEGKVKLTFKAAGYAPQDLEIPVSSSTVVAVSLPRAAPAGKRPGKPEVEF